MTGGRVTPAELPPYRAMLAVDVKDFSTRKGRDHERITEQIPEMLGAAFKRAGLTDLWIKEQRFPRNDGDGYVAGFPPSALPFLLNPFLGALQDELSDRARHDPASTGGPVRMRVVVHVGPVTDSDNPSIGDGSGTARVETHRLLDADAVRQLLERAGPATHVAAIVSARAFEDAVVTGYAGEGEDLYRRVPVEVKQYRGVAFLRVPYPSGDLVGRGLDPAPAPQPELAEQPARTPAFPSTRIDTMNGPGHFGVGDQINGAERIVYRDGRRGGR